MTSAPGVSIQLDPQSLRPLIEQVVTEVLARLDAAQVRLPDRLAYSEPEAARLLGLAPHQLRDERLRGRITASQLTGRRIRYTRDDLVTYLMGRRIGASAEGH
jgi:hypothetical protein